MTTTTQKVSDVAENVTKSVNAQTEKINDSLDGVRQQLLSYGNQIQEYLTKVDAKVDTYKLSIEKHSDGLSLDFAFRATIHRKP